MKIPIITATEPKRVYRNRYAGYGAAAMAGIGMQASGIAVDVARQESILREKERIAQDTLTAIELDNRMNEATRQIREGFLKRNDSENFDADLARQMGELKSSIAPRKPSNELNAAFQRSWNRYSSALSDAVMTQKYRVMEERGRIAVGAMVDNAANEYAATSDPELKAFIKKRSEIEIRKAMNENLVNPIWGENQIRQLDAIFKAKEADAAEAIAIERMTTDPAKLAIDLKDPKYLPGLIDKSRRATLAKEAETAARIAKDQARAEKDRIEAEARENDNKRIGDLMLQRKYTEAYAEALKSNYITGGDKEAWRRASELAAKERPVDKKIENAETVKVLDMIRENKPMEEIRNYTLQTAKMGEQRKKELIARIEADYDRETAWTRKFMLDTIRDLIIPKRGLTEKFLQTTLETNAVTEASLVAMDWLEKQYMAKNRVTREDALRVARLIASNYQVTVTEQIEFLETEAKRMQEEAEKAGREKEKELKGEKGPQIIRKRIIK